MPEIGEIARIVHFLRKHAVGKTIRAIKTQEDDIVYGKVGTSAAAFQKALTGKKVVDAKQQGKYFWLQMDSQPHALMHFGMTGWIYFSNEETSHYKAAKIEDKVWPPKFWKFILDMEGDERCEVAFCDARRLGRIRLVEAPADQMRKTTPLKENGPDPVIDSDIVTVDWLASKMKAKRVPVKAFLLDQANLSGVGNWVGDEVLFQAKLHPEQYTNTFTEKQIKDLHDSLIQVCTIAVETLGETEKFPDNWLMRYRWDKGKSTGGKLPTGEKITWLKVGGRTSAVVPSIQKKTGPVAGDTNSSPEESQGSDEEKANVKKRARKPKAASSKMPNKIKEEEEEEEDKPSVKKSRTSTVKTGNKKAIKEEPEPEGLNRRRSTRNASKK